MAERPCPAERSAQAQKAPARLLREFVAVGLDLAPDLYGRPPEQSRAQKAISRSAGVISVASAVAGNDPGTQGACRGLHQRPVFVVVNAAVALSAMTEGAHYGVDVLAGLATAGLVTVLVNAMQTVRHRNIIPAGVARA